MKIVIIGGYGTFGLRLAKLLAGQDRLTIWLAGRRFSKAKAACEELTDSPADFRALRLDRSQPLAPQLDFTADIIVDCSGPFQNYGHNEASTETYAVPLYAISVRAHYLDIADGADFVANIAQLDQAAKAAGVSVISGLSTYPCLTSAVSAELSKQMERITHITAGIAPSAKVAMGRSVLDAVLSYAGQPVGGGRYGLIDGTRETIAVPGQLPMPRLPFSAACAPDSSVLRAQFGPHIDVLTCAGSQPASLHYMLRGLARLSRYKLLPPLSRFSALLYQVQKLIKIGDARGGMFVKVQGEKNGEMVSQKWGVLAPGDRGPNIPVLPVYILIKRFLAGETLGAGARHSAGVVSLADYETEFAKLGIDSGAFTPTGADQSLFQSRLAKALGSLPPPIIALHSQTESQSYGGKAQITRGRNPLAWLIGAIFGFPKDGENIQTQVDIEITPKGERWTRHFGGRKMSSHLSKGAGRYAHYITERFGIISVHMALIPHEDRLHYKIQKWSCLGLPLPAILAPRAEAYEYVENGRFHFHVDMRAPLIGRLVKYQGWLEALPKAE